MKWNLRLTAAHQGIWTASDLQRRLAEQGLVISAGKMSSLWSGTPHSIKLSDLDVLCAVLNVSPAELLVPEPVAVPAPDSAAETATGDTPFTAPTTAMPGTPATAPTATASAASVRPRRRSGRSLPPPV